MIAGRGKRIFKAAENAGRVVVYQRSLAVLDRRRVDNLAAERLADCLHTEAHAEDWQPPGKVVDHIQRHTRGVRRARPRRHHDPLGGHRRYLRHVNAVIAKHRNLRAEFAEILHQVVGERIVVVYHQDHAAGPEGKHII